MMPGASEADAAGSEAMTEGESASATEPTYRPLPVPPGPNDCVVQVTPLPPIKIIEKD